MRTLGGVAAAAALATLAAGCGSGGSSAPAPAQTAVIPSTSPTAEASPARRAAHDAAPAQREPRRLRYAYPIRRCSSSPSASHHDYPASDIFTRRGCRFVAVTSGRVDEVSRRDRWSASVDAGATRGGLSVSIVGDDGVRYYGSHLLSIGPGIRRGARVHPGQLLGLVDNTGDARYTPTHVHFGISWPTRRGVWWVRRGMVWPQRYLTAWREGRDLSPAREVRRVHHRMGDVPPCGVLC